MVDDGVFPVIWRRTLDVGDGGRGSSDGCATDALSLGMCLPLRWGRRGGWNRRLLPLAKTPDPMGSALKDRYRSGRGRDDAGDDGTADDGEDGAGTKGGGKGISTLLAWAATTWPSCCDSCSASWGCRAGSSIGGSPPAGAAMLPLA